jgi:hypothetical protein
MAAKQVVCRSLERFSGICASGSLAGNPVEPAQFCIELADHQGEHPDGFMVPMAHLFEHGAESGMLAGKFVLKKFATAAKLALKCGWRSLPGESEPSEKGGTIALSGPAFALKCRGESAAALRGGCKNAALWTSSGIGAQSGND